MIGPYPLEPGCVRGGIESVTSVLVPALAQREDVESITVVRFHDGDAPVPFRREGSKVEVHYLRSQRWLRTISGSYLDLCRARRLVRRLHPDVVHGQEIGLSGAIALRCGPHTAVTVHGLALPAAASDRPGIRCLRRVLRDGLMRRMQRSVLSRAKLVISISSWDAKVFDVALQGDRVLIANPIGAEFFALAPSGHTRPHLLFAGLFTESKNPIGVINAFALARTCVPAATLTLVGPHPDPDYLRAVEDRVEELDLHDCVEIADLVGVERMRCEIAAARAVVLFSREENAPTILAQAMAAGKPVVASCVGGVPDMVGDGETGFVVASDDETALADRMVRLLGDQALALRMGWRAHEIAVDRFTAARVAEKTVAAYRELLSGRAT
ncbi:MAG: glycosyltransferase family 4 protein [Actinomycetota bacterium]